MYKEAKFAADDAEETKRIVCQVRDDVEDLKKENVGLKNNLAIIRVQTSSMGDQMKEMMTLLKKTMKPQS